MFFLGVDLDSRCDYRSNVDFVNLFGIILSGFLYENFPLLFFHWATYPFLNLSGALPCNTRLLYLKYYRAFSDILWIDRKNCSECIIKNRWSLKLLSSCWRPECDCSCIICKRQPPSLRDICSEIYFRSVGHFKLNTLTTYNQYVNAIDSRLVPSWQPSSRIFFNPHFVPLRLFRN